MGDRFQRFKTRDKSERAAERHIMVKMLIAAGHSRAVAIKKAKSMVR